MGDELRILVGGLMSGNRVKRMRLRVNGTRHFNATLSNSPRYPWQLEATLVVRDALAAVLVVRLLSHRRRWDHTTAVIPIDLSQAITLEVSGKLTRASESITREMAVASTFRHEGV